ncbi:MAG: SRPBCC family protein [Perlucidibaca sp.]
MHTSESRTLSITIRRCPHQVYDFLTEPLNLPTWASGLGGNIRVSPEPAGGWLADTPGGTITIHFSPANDFGVLDHVVTLTSGASLFVPMRVLINGGGSEVLVTLFRQPGISDEAYQADADWVARDLASLKSLLEAAAG